MMLRPPLSPSQQKRRDKPGSKFRQSSCCYLYIDTGAEEKTPDNGVHVVFFPESLKSNVGGQCQIVQPAPTVQDICREGLTFEAVNAALK